MRKTGRRVLRAYCLARSHLRHSALSSIFEVASEWQENQFTALMTWISGAPLADFTGVFSLLADDQQESSVEALALRWIRIACEALAVLHDNGLIHGDVSPRNLIVSGSNLVLTDYDFVCKIGDQLRVPATVLYCSPSYETKLAASPSDDIYSLAASFFHVVFDKHPFRHGSDLDKKRGLNWENIAREQCPTLAAFLDRATNSDPKLRFGSVAEVLGSLKPSEVISITSEQEQSVPVTHQMPLPQLREQRIEWLYHLLQSYPGSQWGNSETRGLDTSFAAQTYVETALENSLLDDIRQRRLRLIILCGNAGDGKTALLQHIAVRLGFGKHQSADRILEGKLPGGPFVSMNLDGSASWRGRSADEILDEFLKPFRDGPPTQDRVHLLAINDGRLMEWIDGAIERNANNEFPVAIELYQLLQMETASEDSHIRFITLNRRSLVGDISSDQNQIDTAFLDRLMNHLYGDTEAEKIWSRCQSCSAQDRCEVFRVARLFGPDGIPSQSEATIRFRARQRLFEAMQAVHLRGEIHITMRELRAALVYILFGVHLCDDYHSEVAMDAIPYWDRAFSADSVARQGEVLRELARFDPALEAHPQIDRYLLSNSRQDAQTTAPRYSNLALGSARRRAFFEWTAQDNELIAGDRNALDLARGSHLRQFRDLPLADATELADVCERLCKGISRLEDLPPQAIDRPGVVPLRITPRTPTETAFWVEKPISSFRLEADVPAQTKGVERLHRQAFLIYRYRNNRDEERLALGAELFHLLLELADGYQLGDVSTDDTFAHLSIFVQRLVREDERELLAWNPMKDTLTFKIAAVVKGVDGVQRQKMVIEPLLSEGSS
jgi:serine/threonine protein kinase